jgi:hypothetical protein
MAEREFASKAKAFIVRIEVLVHDEEALTDDVLCEELGDWLDGYAETLQCTPLRIQVREESDIHDPVTCRHCGVTSQDTTDWILDAEVLWLCPACQAKASREQAVTL